MTDLTEMTRFNVGLSVDVETDKLRYVGSPADWKWDRIIDKMIGDEAENCARVLYVEATIVFTANEDGDMVGEATFPEGSKDSPQLEDSFIQILGYAQDHIADNRYKFGGSEEEQREDLTKFIQVRDFARGYFCNPEIGDSRIDNFVNGLPEDPTIARYGKAT